MRDGSGRRARVREHAVRRRRSWQRAEPTRADAVLARERLQDREPAVRITGRVLGDARGERRRERVLFREDLREAAHVAFDLTHHLRMTMRRIGVERIARDTVTERDRTRLSVRIAIREERALRRTFVLCAGQCAEHLIVGAVLHHQDDEVLDAPAQARVRRERSAFRKRTSRERGGSDAGLEDSSARELHSRPSR